MPNVVSGNQNCIQKKMQHVKVVFIDLMCIQEISFIIVVLSEDYGFSLIIFKIYFEKNFVQIQCIRIVSVCIWTKIMSVYQTCILKSNILGANVPNPAIIEQALLSSWECMR